MLPTCDAASPRGGWFFLTLCEITDAAPSAQYQLIHRCGATGFTHHPCIEHLIYGVRTRSALRCRDVLALIHAAAGRPRDPPAADAVDTAHDAGVPRAAQPHALQAAPAAPSVAADTAQPAVVTSALGHDTFPDAIRAPFHLLRSHAVRRGMSTNPRGVRHSRLLINNFLLHNGTVHSKMYYCRN